MVTPDQRRLREHPRSTPEGRRVGLAVGSGERRGGRRGVQGLRRARDHAHSRPPAHHVAGRQHAEDRDGFRHADAPVPFRPFDRLRAGGQAARADKAELAGLFGGAVGAAGARTGTPLPGLGATRQGTGGRSLEVVTTQLRPGYLRKNGVPYSANAALTEYYDLSKERNGDTWFVVTTIVDDPQYLKEPFVTSTNFKKQSDATGWDATNGSFPPAGAGTCRYR